MEARIFLVETGAREITSLRNFIQSQKLGSIALLSIGGQDALAQIPDGLKKNKINLSIIGDDFDWERPMNHLATAIKAAFPHMPIIGHAFYQIQNVDTFIALHESPQLLIAAIQGFAQKDFKLP